MHTTWASDYLPTIYPTNVIKDNHKDLTTGILIIFFTVVEKQFYMGIFVPFFIF